MRVINVVVSFFLILNQIGYIFNKFFGINTRINSEVFPTANSIGNSKNILGDKYCILSAFIYFLRVGTDGTAVDELVEFVMIGLILEGNSFFSFGPGRVLLHDVLI